MADNCVHHSSSPHCDPASGCEAAEGDGKAIGGFLQSLSLIPMSLAYDMLADPVVMMK